MDGRGEDLLLRVPMTVDTTRMTCLQWRVIGGKGGRDSDHVHPSPLGDQRREAICIRQSTSKRVERCTSCSSSDVRRGGGGAKGRLLLVRSNRRSAGGDAWCRRLQSTAKNQVLGIYNNQMAMWPIAWVCSPRCPASQGLPALVGMTRPTQAPRPCCQGTRPPSRPWTRRRPPRRTAWSRCAWQAWTWHPPSPSGGVQDQGHRCGIQLCLGAKDAEAMYSTIDSREARNLCRGGGRACCL